VGLTLLSLVPVLGGAADIGSLAPFSVALLLLQTIPLIFRHVAPLPVLIVTGAATTIHAFFATDSLSSSLGSLVALYTVADHLDRRTAVASTIALGTALGALVAVKGGIPLALGSLVQLEVTCFVCWLLGTWSRERRAYIGTVEERAERAERDRAVERERAVVEERSRIARELHDVVTHHVSVIVIQAGAARRALARHPADATTAIEAIDGAGRQALLDMRRMLGILGAPGPAETTAEAREPMPDLDRLGALLETVRAAGLPVELSIAGERRPLDPGVGLSAYRIIQEALTNALKHSAGARTRVEVEYEPGSLLVRVSDEGAARPSPASAQGRDPDSTDEHGGDPGVAGLGRGLIGMRERAAMLGGTLEAGPFGPGGRGFRIEARLPAPALSATATPA
jgi:signal transduction histidine kinase